MSKEIIFTKDAPAPLGGAPYNQAVKAAGLVFLAGQLGLDPATGVLVEGGVQAQTQRIFDNIAAVLEAAGSDLSKIVRTQVFMVDLGDFAQMNEVYAQRMPEPFPARSTFQVAALPAGGIVEIEVVATV